MTKTEAIAAGSNIYTSGKVCKYRHDSGRYVSNNDCVVCNKERTLKFFRANKGYHADYMKAYGPKWKKANKGLVNYHTNARRLRTKNQTPKWADQEAIKAFYEACPEGHHVDHVIPLKGKNVCGLHTVQNFQYLTAKANVEKGNSFNV